MRAALLVTALLIMVSIAAASPAVAQQADEPRVALEGLDPVLLVEGQEVEGDEALAITRGRFVYRFSSAATLERFNGDPERRDRIGQELEPVSRRAARCE